MDTGWGSSYTHAAPTRTRARTAGPPIPHTALAFQPSEYNDWKFSNNPTFLEVLEEFPSLHVPAAFLLSQLPILKPRYYSISSSQDHTPTEVHLTVAVVTYRTRGETGRLWCHLHLSF